MENIQKFNCTECGKCCSNPPNVNFYEMLELSDEFIFQTNHHVILSKINNLIDKDLALHYQRLGHSIVMPELDATMFYFIDFSPIQLLSYKSCSKLENNLCSIYGKRPDSCRIKPGSFHVPHTMQEKHIKIFTQKKEYQCDTSDSASSYFYPDEHSFAQPYNQTIYNRNINSIRESTDIFIDFLEQINEEKKNEHFKMLFNSLTKNQNVISDVITIMHAYQSNGLISSSVIETFFQNQLKLIENESKKTTFFQLKENLKVNRFYKKMISDYNKYLTQKPYNNTSQDIFYE